MIPFLKKKARILLDNVLSDAIERLHNDGHTEDAKVLRKVFKYCLGEEPVV